MAPQGFPGAEIKALHKDKGVFPQPTQKQNQWEPIELFLVYFLQNWKKILLSDWPFGYPAHIGYYQYTYKDLLKKDFSKLSQEKILNYLIGTSSWWMNGKTEPSKYK